MLDSSQTVTTTTLLEGLFDPENRDVWEEFDARYRPIITGFARGLGLPDEDAADVAQETLARFLREYRAGKYDRQRGRLRSWIVGIVKYRVAELRRSRHARRETRGESAMDDMPAEADLEALWEAQRRSALLQQAVRELRISTRSSEKTLLAFEMYVVKQMPIDAVTQELGITAQDVYMAKNRVAERLRTIIARLDDVFDDGGHA